MGFFDSKASKFFIDDAGATEREMTAFISELSGLPGPRDLNEVTALGDGGRKFIAGLENVTITISGHFDDTVTTGPDEVFGGLRTDETPRTFKYGPKGDTAGFVRYTGTMLVTTYELGSRVGNQVTFSVTLQVNGQVTRDTF